VNDILDTLGRVAGDVLVSAAGLFLGFVLYALIFRPGLLVRKR